MSRHRAISEVSMWHLAGAFCAAIAALFTPLFSPAKAAAISCERELYADVVAIDMPLMWNRFGAQNINGMMFALRNDVINLTTGEPIGGTNPVGNVALRPDKRPRPLVLRMGAGDCLTYKVTNLLATPANPFAAPVPNGPPPVAGEERSLIPFNLNVDDQVADRRVSLRFQGTELVNSIGEDGTNVGENEAYGGNGLVNQGATSPPITIYAPKENTYVGTSYGATTGGEGLGGSTASGLFAVLNVGPKGAAFYRSQVTREEMDLAVDTDSLESCTSPATPGYTCDGHPILNYEAEYPSGDPWYSEGKSGLPIIRMVDDSNNIVHSDLNAIVANGGSDYVLDGNGWFPPSTYPLESVGKRNPTVPNRLEAFREFTIAFHDEVATKQAFPLWFEDPILRHTLHGVRDSFMINYGSGGIGSEIIASRLRVGPPHDCVNCSYEEFFLTAFTVGDVGLLTDIPANFGLEQCDPALNNCAATGPKANYALFPDDPSNVHHSYTGDFTKFRNVHAGPGEQHVFHLHNHQWLFNANDDNSNYLDAQGIGPGAGYTYEINFGGSGNRNKTSGDAIFHCHFYPHFAQGMWEMWRNHDVFEQGTALQTTDDGPGGYHTSFVTDGIGLGDGTPAAGARALPDGEILAGTPIPGLVPLPGKPMPPMPQATVTVVENSNQICVGAAPDFGLAAPVDTDPFTCPLGFAARPTGSLAQVERPGPGESVGNPGYPFWIAGIEHSVGQRPPTPPLDMITQKQAADLKKYGGPLWQHPGFDDPGAVHGWDGGLPRYTANGYAAGSTAIVSVLEARLDLSKEMTKVKPNFFPEEGTDLEKAAMAYHAQRCHNTFNPDGTPAVCDVPGPGGTGGYITNGALPVPGAPFQEPCIDDQGRLLTVEDDGSGNQVAVVGNFFDGAGGMGIHGSSPFNANTPRVYKAANVQFDVVFNKQGYHYPQQRIVALWQDVVPTVLKERPPEPFILRNNTFDCTQYVHSNVVPKTYELDDYQVRTPTDIIGQHIHLPKWDLTTADGAANGWNYEDGTLSSEMVVEIIHAINSYVAEHPAEADTVLSYAPNTGRDGQEVIDSDNRNITVEGSLLESDHPFFGTTPFAAEWIGARSTMQRWFFDPVVNVQNVDRGLGIIFTHDHYGPSTHQQIGLYATVLAEPAGSKWVHNETGTQLYTRTGTDAAADGGPTSWQAAILTGEDGIGGYTQNVSAELVENFREFYFEYSDFQHAYQPGVYVGANEYGFPRDEYEFANTAEDPANVVGDDPAKIGDGHCDPGELCTAPMVIGGPGQTANTKLLAAQGDLAPDPNSFRDAISPSYRQQAPLTGDLANFPTDIWVFPPVCPVAPNPQAADPNPTPPERPCPEAISADDPGMYVTNYRNEPLTSRIFDPWKRGPDGKYGTQADGLAGDLSYAMDSNVHRAIDALNTAEGLAPPGYFDGVCSNGVFCPPINDTAALNPGDPFTPMMRIIDGDRVHMRVQAGAHEEEHSKGVHGVRWLQSGSGFGEAKNSGWRNAQPGGISEQFTFRTPVFADFNQRGNTADYAYSANTSTDGWASGVWGILRSYKNQQNDLFTLPNNDPTMALNIVNKNDFNRVCPKSAPVRSYDITAVLAEDVLPTPSGVTVQDLFPGAHEGRAPNGGTLVYNSRADMVAPTLAARGGQGPLHDPTAILYLHTEDLIPWDAYPDYYMQKKQKVWFWNSDDPWCINGGSGVQASLPGCRVKVKTENYDGTPYTVPTEPIVIRANAGDCIEVTLRNKVLNQAEDDYGHKVCDADGVPAFEVHSSLKYPLSVDADGDGICESPPDGTVHWDKMPDLATASATMATQRRDRDDPQGMTSFQTNLMVPSAHVGLHPALVEYDVTRSDGTQVGKNGGKQVVQPGGQTSYQWYAGVIEQRPAPGPSNKRNIMLVATPVEFGGFNLAPSDKLEQGQKGLFGAGVIYPEGSGWLTDLGSNTAADVGPDYDGDGLPDSVAFRDFTTIAQKAATMFYKDSYPVENILGEGTFGVTEDSQDMGQMAINYGTEPLWFRFGVNPTHAAGNAGAGAGFLGGQTDAGDAYSNGLVGDVDPETPVFYAEAGKPFRQHVLMPFGAGRGSTFDLHGHVWQRDPYVCPNDADLGLPGKCDMGNGVPGVNGTGSVGSQALGDNPIGFGLGGIESWFAGEHYEVVIPSAGGDNGVLGDYLFRDHMGLGNAQGLWGIVRVLPPYGS